MSLGVSVSRKDVIKLLGPPVDSPHCAEAGDQLIGCLLKSKYDESQCERENKMLQLCLMNAPKHDRVASIQRRRTLVWNILRTAGLLSKKKL